VTEIRSAARASPRALARMAGLFELLEAASGAPGQFILLGTLVVSGDAAATSRNILENTTQFQLGVAANLVSVAFHVVWTYLMYEVLRPVDRGLSLFAAFAGLTAAALQALAAVIQVAPLAVLNNGQPIGGLTPELQQGLAFAFLRLNARAYNIYLVFFGFWLLLIGYLVYRSRFMPQLVGAFVMLSGLTWVLQIWPPLVNAVSPWNLILDGPGEISLMLWLLVFGVNADRWRQRAGFTTSS